MDHMMPVMDGVEATKIIREMGYREPVVALTANVIAGQEKMFLSNGFDDFISKPIDVRQLNLVLNRLVRDKHPPEVVEDARRRASERNLKNGSKSNSANDLTLTYSKTFLADAAKSLKVLEELFSKGIASDSDQLHTYALHVHGLKSALKIIGKEELSAVAARLEELAYKENVETINAETSTFLQQLQTIMAEIDTSAVAPIKPAIEHREDVDMLRERLQIILNACYDYDNTAIEKALDELSIKLWSPKTTELLDFIADQLLLSGFDEIADAVNKAL
jgi:CheY-like chemotaxis protein